MAMRAASSSGNGANGNDPNDADEGGNRLQNTSVVIVVGTIDTNTVDVEVLVDSAPANASYPIRVRRISRSMVVRTRARPT